MKGRGAGLELVCLDLGDTLIRPRPSWTDVYLAACRDAGVALSRERLEKGFVTALAAGGLDQLGPFEATAAASFERITRFDAEVMAAAGVADLPDAFYHMVAARFAAPSSWQVFGDVEPALQRLRAAGIRLCIISNWVWDAPRLVAALGLAGWFDTVVVSDRVGYNKPHPAIFRAALEATGVAPSRTAHVGDSYGKDVVGATAVGMQAVLLQRAGLAAADVPPLPGGRPVAIAHDLLEAADQLGVP